MTDRRSRLTTFVLVPLIFAAAGVLGYYTWATASRFVALGEQTIAENTLLLVREKVQEIEEYIISQDNAAFDFVNFDNLGELESAWRPNAREVTPSVRALFVIDEEGSLHTLAIRGNAEQKEAFRRMYERYIRRELDIREVRLRRLVHLHDNFGDQNLLLSYRVQLVRGRRMAIFAHHDTGYIVREELPRLFATEEGRPLYNVVSTDNRRIYGPGLSDAGDYLVGHRFPTTLYSWRLQVAPKQAPELEQQGRSRRVTDLALLAIAFAILLIGVIFLVRAASTERHLNNLKGEFIANVSHELKTPLSSVRMFGELLHKDLDRAKLSTEKKEQYLEIICRESERLTALIENVLDFAALERGRQRIRLESKEIVPVVERALDAFRYRMDEGESVTLDVQGEIPQVMLDEQALVLALVNLLDNAVKYGGGSAVIVHVEQVRDFVQIRVRDHGQGIPVDALRHVFERFYRSRRDDHVRGSGIGLALVQHIAQSHRGRAFARNAEEGEGAIVGIALPVVRG